MSLVSTASRGWFVLDLLDMSIMDLCTETRRLLGSQAAERASSSSRGSGEATGVYLGRRISAVVGQRTHEWVLEYAQFRITCL